MPIIEIPDNQKYYGTDTFPQRMVVDLLPALGVRPKIIDDYDATQTYAKNDLIKNDGKLYLANEAIPANTPLTGNKFVPLTTPADLLNYLTKAETNTKLAERFRDAGAFDPTSNYQKNDVIRVGERFYVANQFLLGNNRETAAQAIDIHLSGNGITPLSAFGKEDLYTKAETRQEIGGSIEREEKDATISKPSFSFQIASALDQFEDVIHNESAVWALPAFGDAIPGKAFTITADFLFTASGGDSPEIIQIDLIVDGEVISTLRNVFSDAFRPGARSITFPVKSGAYSDEGAVAMRITMFYSGPVQVTLAISAVKVEATGYLNAPLTKQAQAYFKDAGVYDRQQAYKKNDIVTNANAIYLVKEDLDADATTSIDDARFLPFSTGGGAVDLSDYFTQDETREAIAESVVDDEKPLTINTPRIALDLSAQDATEQRVTTRTAFNYPTGLSAIKEKTISIILDVALVTTSYTGSPPDFLNLILEKDTGEAIAEASGLALGVEGNSQRLTLPITNKDVVNGGQGITLILVANVTGVRFEGFLQITKAVLIAKAVLHEDIVRLADASANRAEAAAKATAQEQIDAINTTLINVNHRLLSDTNFRKLNNLKERTKQAKNFIQARFRNGRTGGLSADTFTYTPNSNTLDVSLPDGTADAYLRQGTQDLAVDNAVASGGGRITYRQQVTPNVALTIYTLSSEQVLELVDDVALFMRSYTAFVANFSPAVLDVIKRTQVVEATGTKEERTTLLPSVTGLKRVKFTDATATEQTFTLGQSSFNGNLIAISHATHAANALLPLLQINLTSGAKRPIIRISEDGGHVELLRIQQATEARTGVPTKVFLHTRQQPFLDVYNLVTTEGSAAHHNAINTELFLIVPTGTPAGTNLTITLDPFSHELIYDNNSDGRHTFAIAIGGNAEVNAPTQTATQSDTSITGTMDLDVQYTPANGTIPAMVRVSNNFHGREQDIQVTSDRIWKVAASFTETKDIPAMQPQDVWERIFGSIGRIDAFFTIQTNAQGYYEVSLPNTAQRRQVTFPVGNIDTRVARSTASTTNDITITSDASENYLVSIEKVGSIANTDIGLLEPSVTAHAFAMGLFVLNDQTGQRLNFPIEIDYPEKGEGGGGGGGVNFSVEAKEGFIIAKQGESFVSIDKDSFGVNSHPIYLPAYFATPQTSTGDKDLFDYVCSGRIIRNRSTLGRFVASSSITISAVVITSYIRQDIRINNPTFSLLGDSALRYNISATSVSASVTPKSTGENLSFTIAINFGNPVEQILLGFAERSGYFILTTLQANRSIDLSSISFELLVNYPDTLYVRRCITAQILDSSRIGGRLGSPGQFQVVNADGDALEYKQAPTYRKAILWQSTGSSAMELDFEADELEAAVGVRSILDLKGLQIELHQGGNQNRREDIAILTRAKGLNTNPFRFGNAVLSEISALRLVCDTGMWAVIGETF